MDGLDREKKEISVAPTLDEDGVEIIPRRSFRYGSLVALGRFSTVGNLMGGLSGGSIMIEGVLARLLYWSLHKMHEIALHGGVKTEMTAYAHFISTPSWAWIKLH